MAKTFRRLLIVLLAFSPYVSAVELVGSIRSPGGALPPVIEVIADRRDKLPPITGVVESNRYRIELPETGMYRLRLQAKGWNAEPKMIFDPKTAGALDFLIYPAQVPEPALAAELLEMGKQDQQMRANIPRGKPDPALWKRLQDADLVREERLSVILATKGWPTISMVGHEAAGNAWLIAQHGSADFLKRCLKLMQAAAARLEIAPHRLALSIDRELTHDHKKQIYGSQFQTTSDGVTTAFPIDDPENLERRRAEMGMEPFSEYRKRIEK